ncbi:MAG: hypothetical protein QOD77_1890 [Thermoplasmata archaeon]|jgi:hypothetical protein|nr:hypothetical protein [Thermoplasmata archaeon]
MKRVYSNRFHILGDSAGARQPTLWDDVIREVEAWAVDVATRRGAPAVDTAVLRKPGGYAAPNGFTVEINDIRGTKANLFSVKVTHLDADNPLLKWQTIIEVAAASGNIEVLVTMFTGYTKPVIRPLASRGSQPRVVRSLAEKFHCAINGQRLITTAIPGGPSADHFVERVLLDPERIMPVVVVTKNKEGRYPVDAKWLASILVGIAQVYVADDDAFTFSLTDRIGRPLGVFDGGVRTYWPQFRTSDSPQFHTLFLGYQLDEMYRRGDKPLFAVAERLYALMAASLVESRTGATARTLIAQEKMAGAEKAKTIPQLQAELVQRDEQIAVLTETNKGLQAQVEQLQDAMWQINALRREGGEQVDFLDTCKGAKTADQILDAAVQLLPGLVIHDHAYTTSDGVKSGRLDELANTLYILDQTASRYKDGGGLGKPFKEVAFEIAQERNLKHGKLTMNDSETALNQFRDERMIRFEDRDLTLESHFTIAKGSVDCLNVYFEPLPNRKQVLVGYVGPHLTNKGNR